MQDLKPLLLFNKVGLHRIPVELIREMKALAVARRCQVSVVWMEAAQQYLRRHRAQQQKPASIDILASAEVSDER